VRTITIGQVQTGEASIKSGLSPGELVVVDGAERLREGTRVDLRPQSSGTTENVGTQQKGY
jgi:multidrug efflux system membrane fusion protein